MKPQPWRLYFLAVLFCVVLLGRIHVLSAVNAIKNAIPTPLPAELIPLQQQADSLRALHQPKSAPGPDDWLSLYPEAGQSFAQYVSSQSRRPVREQYQTIYVVPLGQFSDQQSEIIQRTSQFMAIYFGLPVKELPGIEFEAKLPATAQRLRGDGHRQLDAHWLQEMLLLPQRPQDAAAVIGIVADDLWSESLNFVFGQATPEERLGVWSLYRLGDPSTDEAQFKKCQWRTLQVATHETGHLLGFAHCTAFECCMNGAAHLEESDRHPLELCPECQAKVWWTCGVAAKERTHQLQLFAESQGLELEARRWREQAKILEGRKP